MANFFSGKAVIITGASSGIGLALAHAFGSEGARLVINGRDAAKLEQAAAGLRAAGIAVTALPGDVSREEDCQQLAAAALQAYGRIDVLINNAGISMRALFQDLDLKVIRQVMDINFWGTVYCTKFCLPEIIKAKGSIIAISSIAGLRGLPARTGYSASKFAVNGFIEALRTELLPTGVHVLLACPGFTASNIRNVALAANGSAQGESPRDEGKMMTAEAVAQAIVQATLRRRRDLILTGQGKLTAFLNKWLPGLMDKMVFNHLAKEADSPLKKQG